MTKPFVWTPARRWAQELRSLHGMHGICLNGSTEKFFTPKEWRKLNEIFLAAIERHKDNKP
jgi:hypothetical protein